LFKQGLTKGRAVLAAHTLRESLWTTVVFFLWVAFIGVGLWLLVRLFRNTNFVTEHRAWRIAVKVLLVVFTVFIPVLGVPVLFGIWYFTRSRGAELGERDEPEFVQLPKAPMPRADGTPSARSLPFPPHSAARAEGEATEPPPPFE
jgi:hypothetical protein